MSVLLSKRGETGWFALKKRQLSFHSGCRRSQGGVQLHLGSNHSCLLNLNARLLRHKIVVMGDVPNPLSFNGWYACCVFCHPQRISDTICCIFEIETNYNKSSACWVSGAILLSLPQFMYIVSEEPNHVLVCEAIVLKETKK